LLSWHVNKLELNYYYYYYYSWWWWWWWSQAMLDVVEPQSTSVLTGCLFRDYVRWWCLGGYRAENMVPE
jgi:hypothetical protein